MKNGPLTSCHSAEGSPSLRSSSLVSEGAEAMVDLANVLIIEWIDRDSSVLLLKITIRAGGLLSAGLLSAGLLSAFHTLARLLEEGGTITEPESDGIVLVLGTCVA